jgi:hypothetical protein
MRWEGDPWGAGPGRAVVPGCSDGSGHRAQKGWGLGSAVTGDRPFSLVNERWGHQCIPRRGGDPRDRGPGQPSAGRASESSAAAPALAPATASTDGQGPILFASGWESPKPST